jgi:hypothetical protein
MASMKKWQKFGSGKLRGQTLWRDGRTKLDPYRDISEGGQKHEWIEKRYPG